MNVPSSTASMKYSRQCARSDWRAPKFAASPAASRPRRHCSSLYIRDCSWLLRMGCDGLQEVTKISHFSFAERQSPFVRKLRETFVRLPHLTASEQVLAGTEPARCLVQESLSIHRRLLKPLTNSEM